MLNIEQGMNSREPQFDFPIHTLQSRFILKSTPSPTLIPEQPPKGKFPLGSSLGISHCMTPSDDRKAVIVSSATVSSRSVTGTHLSFFYCITSAVRKQKRRRDFLSGRAPEAVGSDAKKSLMWSPLIFFQCGVII
jgi:hypothetical protein